LDSSTALHEEDIDAGTFLWAILKRELLQDKFDFKHRMAALDTALKFGTA
jgi:hypothetical protein